MTNKRDTLTALIFMDEASMVSIIDVAFMQYAQLIADIYNDIYDSCIQQYYAQYSPTKYDRHGDLSGFNLYSASDIYADSMVVNLVLEASNLLPYKGKGDKRYAVLSTVLDGLRGAASRKTPPGWPMNWYASYPNEYSAHAEWYSSKTTLRDILQDFASNGVNETKDIFFDYIGNSI